MGGCKANRDVLETEHVWKIFVERYSSIISRGGVLCGDFGRNGIGVGMESELF